MKIKLRTSVSNRSQFELVGVKSYFCDRGTVESRISCFLFSPTEKKNQGGEERERRPQLISALRKLPPKACNF